MEQSLSRSTAITLGLFTLLALGLGAVTLGAVAARDRVFGETFELDAAFARVDDIEAGTAVTVRGMNAGTVSGVTLPDDDGPFRVRLRLDARFRQRLYADAVARTQARGLLGGQTVALDPGTPAAGPLTADVIPARPTPDIAAVTAQVSRLAERVDGVVADVAKSQGTISKLLHDDGLYADARKMVSEVQQQVKGVRGLVESGKQGTDAIARAPIIRNYVVSPSAILIRPECDRQRRVYPAGELFEGDSAAVSENGRARLAHAAAWLNEARFAGSEVVILTLADPSAHRDTADVAAVLTRKRSEAVASLLSEHRCHKLGGWGWLSSTRELKPVGLGVDPPPYLEPESLPAGRTEVVLFVPRN